MNSKKKNNWVLTSALAIAVGGFYVYNKPQLFGSETKLIARNVAQLEGTANFAIANYYLTHVNPDSNRFNVSSDYKGLINSMIIGHLNSAQKDGVLVLAANIGASDSEYKHKGAITELQRAEVREIGAMLKDSNGGTVVVKAGNTNTGIGRLVTTVQDAGFSNQMLAEYNLRVATAGLSAAHAAINHGPYEANKYGTDFMNTKLTHTALVPTAPDVWTVKQNGISQEVLTSMNLVETAERMGVKAISMLTIREGGPIGTEEGLMAITELMKKMAETGRNANEIARIVLQQGFAPGDAPAEIRKYKGTQGVTDLLIQLERMVAADPEFGKTLESLKIQLQVFDPETGKMLSKGLLTVGRLQSFVVRHMASKEGSSLINKAKAYVEAVQMIDMTAADGKEKLAALERQMGIRSDAEIRTLASDIKSLSKSGENATLLAEKVAELNRHQEAIRTRGYANSSVTFYNWLIDITSSYRTQAAKLPADAAEKVIRISEKISTAVERAIRIVDNISLKDGRVVRSVLTEAQRAARKK